LNANHLELIIGIGRVIKREQKESLHVVKIIISITAQNGTSLKFNKK
jgi:hypothetical protein